MRPHRLISVLPLVTFIAACGSKNPVAPTAVTVAGLAIAGADAVVTGATADYTVTVTLTDGTTRTVTPTWNSSNPAVATVDTAGRLEGRSHGSIRLTASSGSQSASKVVRVVNNYAGTWDGRFIVNGCDAPPGVCAAMEVDFFSFPVFLTVSQGGSDLSDVTATLVLPAYYQIRGNISGRVTDDGRLNLAGSSDVRTNGGNVWATFHVGAWDTTLRDGGMMTGRWTQRLTSVSPISNEIMENELETMRRVSTTAVPVSAR